MLTVWEVNIYKISVAFKAFNSKKWFTNSLFKRIIFAKYEFVWTVSMVYSSESVIIESNSPNCRAKYRLIAKLSPSWLPSNSKTGKCPNGVTEKFLLISPESNRIPQYFLQASIFPEMKMVNRRGFSGFLKTIIVHYGFYQQRSALVFNVRCS